MSVFAQQHIKVLGISYLTFSHLGNTLVKLLLLVDPDDVLALSKVVTWAKKKPPHCSGGF